MKLTEPRPELAPGEDGTPKPTLRLRRVRIDTYPENTALLARDCTMYRAAEFQALRKIEVAGGERRLLAELIIADDSSLVGPDELGLGEQAFRRLGLEEGAEVTIAHAKPPESLDAVRRKIAGHTLSASELNAIISDIAAYRYSPMELAAYLVATARFMTTEEMVDVTRAMVSVGNQLSWDAELVVDKHCVGGVPGNRTSMIIVPIVAAHGLHMPKTSSRAITSPAGTADTMEVLANVDLTIGEIREIIEHERGCLVWGGHVNLSPADDVLISVERPLGVDPPEQMVASILSKKIVAGSTHLVVDIPVGPTAKVRTRREAVRLRKMLEYVGEQSGLELDVVITDGSQPIGRGVGPVLEARDVMAVLRNEPDAPADLRERALLLAGRVLDLDPDLRGGAGHARARELLASGEALAAMERIIDRQGRNPETHALGELVHELPAPATGVVAAIDCWRIARIARLAGAPMDKGAGLDLLRKVGDPVKAGEPLYRIHSCVRSSFAFACDMADEESGYAISPGSA